MPTFDAVTLDDAKAILGIEDTASDPALSMLITALTLEIERRLKTQFVQRAVTEYHEGGCKRLYLQVTPIQSVTSITDPASNSIAAGDFTIRQKRWLEAAGNFWHAYTTQGQRTDWTVVYTAGWFASTAAVAADVKRAIIDAIGAMSEAPSSDASSVKVGDLAITYAQPEAGSLAHPAVDAAVRALASYTGVLL